MKEPFRSVFSVGGNRPTYERKPRTIEYTQDIEISKRRIDLSLIGQIVVVVIIVFIGLYNYYQCGSRDAFAGITPVLAGINFCVSVFSFVVHLQSLSRTLIIGSLLINSTISCTMIMIESLTIRCAEATDQITPFCMSFRSATNTCRWGSGKQTTAVGEDRASLTSDKHISIRITLLILAIICFFNTLFQLWLVTCGLKMGKPVYLWRKKHHNSVVVGSGRTFLIALDNSKENLKSTQPTIAESDDYAEKKKRSFEEYLAAKTKSVSSSNSRRTSRIEKKSLASAMANVSAMKKSKILG